MDKRKNYIVLYADEFDADVWEDYCGAAEVPTNSTEIRIWFDPKNVLHVTEDGR